MRFLQRDNGKLVLTSRITLVPGPHDRLIEIIKATPKGQLAPVLAELMRRGLELTEPADSKAEATIRELLEAEGLVGDDYRAIFARSLRTAWQSIAHE